MKRYLVLRIHIPVTGTDNQTIVVWCIKCGWQELPVSYPYPFSPSVVTESWLVAGNIVTMIKIISPRRRYQHVVPGLASGQCDASGNAVWDMWEDCLAGGPPLVRWPQLMSAMWTRKLHLQLPFQTMRWPWRWKLCSKDVGAERGERMTLWSCYASLRPSTFTCFLLWMSKLMCV